MPFYKGQKFSKQHRENISKSAKGRIAWNKGKKGIFKHSPQTIEKMRLTHLGLNTWSKGRPLSEEHKKKLREKAKNQKGSRNHMWKGDSVGYFALHDWVRRNWKVSRKCEFCGTQEAFNYQWANLDGQYKRIRETWALLCNSCHGKHDNKRGKQKKYKII